MTVRESRLDNGIRVLTESRPFVQTTSLGFWVATGTRYETPGEHGISHLLEHMAFKGTGRRSARDIAETIEAVGGDLNAATSHETTAYYARVLGENVPLALDILADILTDSRFDSTGFQAEQHVILQEIGAAIDTPEDLVHDLLQEAAFPDQPIGRSILGTPESVSQFRRDDLENYLAAHYRGPDSAVVAVGAVDHDSFVEQANRHLEGIASAPGPAADAARFVGGDMRDERDLEQVQLVYAMEAPAIADPRFYTARIAASILGGGMSSRLFQEVREKRGLCYSIYAFTYAFSDTGMLGVAAATSPADVPELIDSTFSELKHAAGSITRQELDRAKAQAKVGILMSLENSSSRAEQIARQTIALGRVLETDEIVSRIEGVTLDDVHSMLLEIYAAPSAFSAVGPINGLETVTALRERLIV